MIDGLIGGSVKSMYIMGEDTALSDPDTHHIVHALKPAELLVVQDIFLSETAKTRRCRPAGRLLGGNEALRPL